MICGTVWSFVKNILPLLENLSKDVAWGVSLIFWFGIGQSELMIRALGVSARVLAIRSALCFIAVESMQTGLACVLCFLIILRTFSLRYVLLWAGMAENCNVAACWFFGTVIMKILFSGSICLTSCWPGKCDNTWYNAGNLFEFRNHYVIVIK